MAPTPDLPILLAERFGLADCRTAALPGYEDENHAVTAGNGERFVFKLLAPGADRAALEAQEALLRHLNRRAPELCVPRAVPALDGATVGEHEGRLVRLLTWVEGTPLARVERRPPALLGSLGAFLGRMADALSDFSHPGARRELDWDLLRLPVVGADLAAVSDRRRRDMLEHVALELELGELPAWLRLPRGVIHNDANDHNVLVGADQRVSGLIDFGDLLHSVRVGDLAVAAAYAMLDRERPLEAAESMVAGYHEVLPLSDEELSALYPMICGRLCLSVIHSARNLARRPDDGYLGVSEAPAWRLIERLLGTHPDAVRERFARACGRAPSPDAPAAPSETLARREAHLGPSLSLHSARPLKLCRGVMQRLYAEDGRSYLDLVNNVSHVGHGNPRVVRAAARQMARLNTNTRTLHDLVTRYAERLCASLHPSLEVCTFVCSGSEANELALRMAAAHSGRREVLVLDHAYHGNSAALIGVSPYKFDGAGGGGRPAGVSVMPAPDAYRGLHRGPDAGAAYAEEVVAALERQPVGAFLAEPLLGCGGQVVPPEGFLAAAFEAVRAAGGVCIADEVQVGFGRVGSHMWAHELHGAVPDIVTLGKPMGNGHPLAAVITTRAVARSFANGMEYFNTFGGNPVSCAVGLAVLDEIEQRGLMQHAAELGARFVAGLSTIDSPLVGEVRGRGLFLGVELVRDHQTLEPAAAEASAVVEHMQDRGFLISTDGPLHNVLKLKPPLVIDAADVDATVAALAEVLEDVWARAPGQR